MTGDLIAVLVVNFDATKLSYALRTHEKQIVRFLVDNFEFVSDISLTAKLANSTAFSVVIKTSTVLPFG